MGIRTPEETEALVKAFAKSRGMSAACVEQHWQDPSIASYAIEIGVDRGSSTLFPDSFFKGYAWENALFKILANKLATLEELKVLADLNSGQS